MNNFSVLPFYASVAEQNHRLPYAYGAVYPLYCDDTRILPFQIMRPTRANTITSVVLYDKDGTQVRNLTSDMTFNIVALDDYDVIVYTAQFGYAQELPIGQYYISVSDGVQTWYSDVFTVVSDISPYVKVEWYDDENFVMDAGTIVYRNPKFINTLYLNTEIGKPDYQFEEEGEQRDGYFFPEKQLSEKTYRFTILAPEYLCDVMRFIRMADHIQITADGYTYNADTFLITPKWQTQGDLASVEVEFESNTVAKKLGDARVRRTIGDFNDDYNDDYDGGDTPVPPVPPAPTEAPENDVNFYDYDGFRVASYTIDEAKALTELPTPPSHEGLTFQEWNWTLNDIATYDRQYIDVGANYVPTDGKTHLFIFTNEPNELFSFQLQVRDLTDGAVVDWGDGSATETVARYALKNLEHTYATKGYHEITIFSDQLVTNEGYQLLFNYYNQTYAWNYMVREIWLAANAFMSTLCNIDSIVTFPSNYYFNINTFSSGTIIPVIVVHKNFVSASTNLFYQNCSKISFPQKTTTLTNVRTVQTLFDYGRIVLPEVTDGNTTYYIASANTNIISIPMSFKATGAAVLNGAIVSYIDIVDGWVPNISLTLSASKYWSPANLVRFFTKLGTTQTAITLTFGSTNLAKLTEDQKAIATNKGYTLA